MGFRVPEELLARPLEPGEVRIFLDNAWYIVGPDGEVKPEIMLYPVAQTRALATQPVSISASMVEKG